MIKAIAFDLGGVIVDLDMESCVKACREIGFTTILDYLDPCHQKGFIKDLECGKIGEEEFMAHCRALCRPGVTDEEIGESFTKLVKSIRPETAEYIAELGRRYPIYLLTNNNPLTMRYCSKLFAEAGIPYSIFSGIFCSSEMKLLKPSKEIFLKAVETIGAAPSEILFVDDSPINVQGAEAVGITAALFKPGSSLRKTLDPYLS